MTTNTGTGNNAPGGGSISVGQTLRGAGEVIHGMSEKFRGDVLNTFDGGAANNNHPVAARGQLEANQGLSRLAGTGNGAPGGVPDTHGGAGSAAAAPNTEAAGAGARTGAGAGAGAGAQNTSTYGPSGVAGAGGASAMNSAVGGGTGGTMPQGQYQGQYPSQGGAVPADRGVGRQGGRNDREFQANNGGPQNQNQEYPRQGGGGRPVDATNSGPGTGVPSGGPQRLG